MALAISRFRVATLAAEYMERVREIRTVEGGFAGAAGESFGFGFGSGPCTYGVYDAREHPNPERAGGEPPPLRKKIGGGLLPTAGNFVEIICRATAAAGVA